MIEVLSAYRFLRRMEVGQFLFMWEIATKLHVSEFPENMYLGVLFVKIRTSVLNLFLCGFRTDVLLAKYIFLVELKDCSPVRRSGYAKEYGCHRTRSSWSGRRMHARRACRAHARNPGSGSSSGLRNAYPVIVACNRCKVNDE